MSKNDVSIQELIDSETEKRLAEMASPDYKFPEKITKTDVILMSVAAAASALLIVLCMVGVIA